MAKIQQHFALFLWWKFGNASPQMCLSTQNDILTKLSTWEYGNRNASFSWQKSGKVSRLVRNGASAGFHACIYGVCQHTRARTSRSPSKHYAHWHVSHTRGNRCHLVTWIGMITPQWLYTLYDMNTHLHQLPWANTHATRSKALMAREGHSRSHESPSYKV